MTLIKIIRGSYGLYVDNAVAAKTSKDEPFEVSSSEAERLVKLEVAEIVRGELVKADNKKTDDKKANEMFYDKSMNMTALSEIALKYGVDKSALETCKRRQQIIDLIDASKEADEIEEEGEDDGETPDFGSSDGVVG